MRTLMNKIEMNEPTPIMAGRDNNEVAIAVKLPRHDFMKVRNVRKVKIKTHKMMVSDYPVISVMLKVTGKKSLVLASVWNSYIDTEVFSMLTEQDTMKIYIIDELSAEEIIIEIRNSMKSLLNHMYVKGDIQSCPSNLHKGVLDRFRRLDMNKIWKDIETTETVRDIHVMSLQDLFDIGPRFETNMVLNVSKKDIEAVDFSEAKEIFMNMRTLRKHAKFSLRIIINGYRDETTKLYMIPEVRNYFASLLNMFPEFLYYLEQDQDKYSEIMFCFLEIRVISHEENILFVDTLASKNFVGLLIGGMMEYATRINDDYQDVLDNMYRFFDSFRDWGEALN